MGEFHTGATVIKNANFYQVKFRGHIVAQFSVKDLAVMLALNSDKLNELLENNVHYLEAA